MCANKVEENKYNLTPLSIFIQKVQGVGNLTKKKNKKTKKATQMPLGSEVDLACTHVFAVSHGLLSIPC